MQDFTASAAFLIAQYRLQNQWITHRPDTAGLRDVVARLGAMQAQDYTHALWAVGLRLPGLSAAEVEQALDRGEIVRTHVLRPTWHLVASEDLRWMLALSAPQVKALFIPFARQFGLDTALLDRCNTLLVKALEGGRYRTREELMTELSHAGIPTGQYRDAHIMMWAELDAVVCNGPRRGKQITYALVDERVPDSRNLDRPAALAELARRYFTSHAPATLHDFHWWSGLKMADARAGLEAVQPLLVQETIKDKTYWLPNDFREISTDAPTLQLLPAFDEFLVSYKDRSAALDAGRRVQTITGNGIFKPVIVDNGWVKGIWKRAFPNDKMTLEWAFFEDKHLANSALFRQAAERVARFYGKNLSLKPR